MEDVDKNEFADRALSEDEELMMKEVICDDPELCFLHHYLSDVFRNAESI